MKGCDSNGVPDPRALFLYNGTNINRILRVDRNLIYTTILTRGLNLTSEIERKDTPLYNIGDFQNNFSFHCWRGMDKSDTPLVGSIWHAPHLIGPAWKVIECKEGQVTARYVDAHPNASPWVGFLDEYQPNAGRGRWSFLAGKEYPEDTLYIPLAMPEVKKEENKKPKIAANPVLEVSNSAPVKQILNMKQMWLTWPDAAKLSDRGVEAWHCINTLLQLPLFTRNMTDQENETLKKASFLMGSEEDK
jgi:hypothetical protein